MTLHFECIGIPFVDRAVTSDRMKDLARRGESQPRDDGGSMITWRDTSGAIMVFNANREGIIECATPSFDSKSTMRIKLKELGHDAECRFCDPLIGTQPIPAEHSVTGKEAPGPTFVFQLTNSGTARPEVTPGRLVDLRVAGFVESVKVWRSGADYLNEHAGQPNAAEEMFSGIFDPKAPTASQYWIKSVVRDARKLRNTVTNVDFHWAVLWSGPSEDGALEIVAAEDDVPFGLEAGNIIEAHLWLCAWMPEFKPPHRTTPRWQTLFRRRV